MVDTEIWKEIPGFPDYWISSHGRVRSKFKILTGSAYVRVGLQRDGKGYERLLHGLVLEAFVGPRPTGCEASHIDGDRQNNALTNLMWESKKQNAKRRKEHGNDFFGVGDKNPVVKMTTEKVVKLLLYLKNGGTVRGAARKFDVGRTTIKHILEGHSWKQVTDIEGIPILPKPPGGLTAKLTPDNVIEIRRLVGLGSSVPDVARQFGMCKSSVYQIISGRTWRNVHPESERLA